ncbi:SIS domain-containing protein [Smaragdicoccus niigatensis]|uniref:SIS domain-containing protein n=1 Tax=Smaragdicoccus niigatensis TaxID=359359 RepID=UPI001B7F7B46|nr:SIS domain-containing protein [Smaragdicoccus niigatensis]
MAREIAEQPDVWRRFLREGSDQIAVAKARIADYSPRFVQFVARGTSDHAALYAKYLVEIHHQLPAGLVSPSSTTVYGARPKLEDVLYVAVSQSGGSPDLVKSVSVAREQGALTVAVTNNPDSALAEAAQLHIDVLAGPELSVAATKTYTAELLALYELFVGGGTADLPAFGEQVLANDEAVVTAAQRYRFAQRLITTARGYSYPTAREAALKLMETSYLSAQAFSGADLLHGPLATVDPQVPVIAIVPNNVGGHAMAPVLQRLEERHADILRVGAKLPNVADSLSPLLEILPLQQLALHLALARGGNPDEPRGLFKVTETL